MQQDSCLIYYTNNSFNYSSKVYIGMNNAFFENQVGVSNIARTFNYHKLCRKKKYWSSVPADR